MRTIALHDALPSPEIRKAPVMLCPERACRKASASVSALLPLLLASAPALAQYEVEQDSPVWVRAVIEVKITPERGGGFDRLAERIAKYDEVVSCTLMSGAYDLLVVVEGNDLREVAKFVAEQLSTVQGVLSTATHFMLKPYKEQGILMSAEKQPERLAVAP